MQKQGLSPGRLLVIVAFSLSVFGLLLFLWLSFGGGIPLKPKGYRFQIAFPQAAQLAQQADVRVAGVSVGKVVQKKLDRDGNKTIATIEMENQFSPVRSDARAILRQKTLLGETYVELTTGSKRAPAIAEGGRLRNAEVQPAVALDQVLQIFDSRTRDAFRLWQQELGRASAGRGQDLSDSLGNLPQFSQSADSLLAVLDRREVALSSLVHNTGVTFGALTQNEGQLRNLIVSTADTFDAIASRKEDLARSIQIFPTFLRESRTTLRRLRTFAVRTDPLLVDLGPVLRDAQPTLVSLRRLSPDLNQLFHDLDPLIVAGRTGLPALEHVLNGAGPLLGQLGPFLSELNPILEWLQLNQQQTSDFLSVGASALAIKVPTPNRQGNGHALPQMITVGSPPLLNQTLITPTRSPDNRGNSYLVNAALADPRYPSRFILPNWDCNAPGGGGVKGPTDTPACFVRGPVPFQGQNALFPHVNADSYAP